MIMHAEIFVAMCGVVPCVLRTAVELTQWFPLGGYV